MLVIEVLPSSFLFGSTLISAPSSHFGGVPFASLSLISHTCKAGIISYTIKTNSKKAGSVESHQIDKVFEVSGAW